MRLLVLSIISTAALTAQSPGASATPATSNWRDAYSRPLDAQVTAAPAIWSHLDAMQRSDPEGQSLRDGDIEALLALIDADGVRDADETDLMEELSQQQSVIVTIGQKDSPEQRTSMVNFTGFRRAFRPLLDEQLARSWLGGQDGWSGLVELYHQPHLEYLKERLADIVATQFAIDWSNSNRDNRYAPLRDRITAIYTATNALPADRQRAGHWLLYAGIDRADRRDSAGAIPDFLYDWIKPAPAAPN